ncbi:MAG TPA: TerC family protein [Candidatus Methylomirabilis sp.]|nr:TerC family protein [Candidatus Methylomirabilis sp.]
MEFSWEFVARFLSITILDLTLAGDNAVVIGMAVRSLPEKQRNKGIFWGAFGAIALRVAVTFVVAQLLLIPLLQFGGGVLLIWIAWKLIQNPPGAGEGENVKAASGLLEAIKIIILADFIMSTDNMLAVGAASHGSFFLLMFGLGLSIPIILFCSAMVAKMMNKWPWLVFVGAGILGYVSGEMIVADKMVSPYLHPLGVFAHYGIPVVLAVGIVVVGKLVEKKHQAEGQNKGEALLAK